MRIVLWVGTTFFDQWNHLMTTAHTARLLITCADRSGIVQAVSSFLYHHGANITALDQYATDVQGGTYFMRVEFALDRLQDSREVIQRAFADTVARQYHMHWQMSLVSEVKKVGILVSKYDHALLELLWRWSRGLLPCHITHVVSNHEDLRAAVEGFGVPFTVVPVTKDNKPEAEAQIHALFAGNDLVVLARYMQILSADFVDRWPMKIINIHHSFLPAFVGADPYRQAYDKGVKLIGATAHYVTADLDQGPIIEQNVERVSHRYSVEDLRELGEDVERNVLTRAVRWHLEDRVIVHGNKTIVFD
jgi:formyltetrahydrofolate deformylase